MLAKLARQTALKLITENPGIADRDIAAVIFGPGSPGTMVNEVCRALHDEGVTRRRIRPDYLLGNWLLRDDPQHG